MRPEFETLEKDLMKIQALENEACQAAKYSFKYNPILQNGVLIQREKEVCLESENTIRCREILCLAENNRLDLNSVNFIRVDKNGANEAIRIKGE